MKYFALIFIVAIFPLNACAQWDTVGPSLPKLRPVPALTAVALMSMGASFTYIPAVKDMSVAIRNEVVDANLPRLHFDDYIQYIPAATPLLLNVCGIKGRHSLGRLAMIEAGSYLLGGGWLLAFKQGFGVLRPDNSSYNSFPSGHTFTAFTGAEILRREYGEMYPWIAVLGYSVATLVAAMRVYNNRHWVGDVAAGAGLAILSVSLVYWVLD